MTSRASRGLTSSPQRTLAVRDAEVVEPLVEPRRVASGDVEAEEASVDPGRPEGGEEREQVTLRAADAGDLVDVEDLHAEQLPVDALELVGHPGGREARCGRPRRRVGRADAQLRVAGELGEAPRQRRLCRRRQAGSRSRRR